MNRDGLTVAAALVVFLALLPACGFHLRGDVELPAILQEPNGAAIHFYMANLSGMRRELFPALFEAYQQWRDRPDNTCLLKPIEQGLHHWQAVAEEMLHLFSTRPTAELDEALENLIQQRRL